jgi:hypothetical protein
LFNIIKCLKTTKNDVDNVVNNVDDNNKLIQIDNFNLPINDVMVFKGGLLDNVPTNEVVLRTRRKAIIEED